MSPKSGGCTPHRGGVLVGGVTKNGGCTPPIGGAKKFPERYEDKTSHVNGFTNCHCAGETWTASVKKKMDAGCPQHEKSWKYSMSFLDDHMTNELQLQIYRIYTVIQKTSPPTLCRITLSFHNILSIIFTKCLRK